MTTPLRTPIYFDFTQDKVCITTDLNSVLSQKHLGLPYLLFDYAEPQSDGFLFNERELSRSEQVIAIAEDIERKLNLLQSIVSVGIITS